MNARTIGSVLTLVLATACGGSTEQSAADGITAGSSGAPTASGGAAAAEHDTASGGTAAAEHDTASGGAAAAGHDTAGGSAGHGGAPAQTGDLSNSCPAVAYRSHADIIADLPISVVEAQTAVYTACRNSECYSGKAIANMYNATNMLDGTNFDPGVTLTFSDADPSVTMIWSATFGLSDGDDFKLSVASPIDQTPIAIFDTVVTYHAEISDPTLVGEGFAQGCSQVSVARIDLRASK